MGILQIRHGATGHAVPQVATDVNVVPCGSVVGNGDDRELAHVGVGTQYRGLQQLGERG